MNMETEKITQEELLKELKMKTLSDDALDGIIGGVGIRIDTKCYQQCVAGGKGVDYCKKSCTKSV